MKKIIESYDRVIHKERTQLQYILLDYMLKEEILELKERFQWLEDLQDELKQEGLQKTE